MISAFVLGVNKYGLAVRRQWPQVKFDSHLHLADAICLLRYLQALLRSCTTVLSDACSGSSLRSMIALMRFRASPSGIS